MDAIRNILADQFWFSIVLGLVVFGGIQGAVAYAILLERKISAWTQDRYGPNRVGPYGFLQPIADGVKFFLKEDIVPANVDKALFIFAPWMIFVVALVGFAVIPWGGAFKWGWMSDAAKPIVVQVASIDIGLLYIVAVSSLSVYGVVLGGWASNNKYSFYGAIRAAAQMLSYEVPMGMCLMAAILMTGSLRLEEMVDWQARHGWAVMYHPIAALVLFITALAEANRMPFDLAESEQELVGGYHTEYSALKLALFFLAEYSHMITSSAMMICIFFGGYLVPGWEWLNTTPTFGAALARVAVFAFKIFLFICLYMLIRWTIPRFRFDQLMRLAWKGLVPMTMTLVAAQGVVMYMGWSQWTTTAVNIGVFLLGGFLSVAGGKAVTGRQLSLRRMEAMG